MKLPGRKIMGALLWAAVTVPGASQALAQTPDEQPGARTWYGGLGLGVSNLEPESSGSIYSVDDARDFGFKLFGGYDWSQRLSFEAHYADLGEAKMTPSGVIGYKVYGLSALYYFYQQNQDRRGLNVYGKAGLGFMDNDATLPFERVNDLHVFYGAGLEYGLGKGIALRGELDLYDKDAQFVGLSLLKRYGGARPTPTPTPTPAPRDTDGDGVIDTADQCPATPAGAIVDALGCEFDSDRDGVVDRKDNCPTTPAGTPVDAAGCELDSDGDGVLDSADKCPGTPAGIKVDAMGCELDSDSDGVFDRADKCPGTPAGIKVDAVGCELDGDGDGVLDSADKCPATAPGIKVDAAGCELDSDGDGVLDSADQCPATPAGIKVDAKGCELDSDGDGYVDSRDSCINSKPGAEVDNTGCEIPEVFVLKGVHFETSSDRLLEDSRSVLDDVATILRRYPQLVVEVAGHTDNRGAKAFNEQLSEKRARAVVEYLVSKGANPGNVQPKGYGAAQPVADNRSEAGRAANRRVEMRVLKR